MPIVQGVGDILVYPDLRRVYSLHDALQLLDGKAGLQRRVYFQFLSGRAGIGEQTVRNADVLRPRLLKRDRLRRIGSPDADAPLDNR